MGITKKQLAIAVQGLKEYKDNQAPSINPENGNWMIGTEDTGIPAAGQKGDPGQDGVTPTIEISAETGTWIINGEDTGVSATGPKGEDGADGASPEVEVDPETGCLIIGGVLTSITAESPANETFESYTDEEIKELVDQILNADMMPADLEETETGEEGVEEELSSNDDTPHGEMEVSEAGDV